MERKGEQRRMRRRKHKGKAYRVEEGEFIFTSYLFYVLSQYSQTPAGTCL